MKAKKLYKARLKEIDHDIKKSKKKTKKGKNHKEKKLRRRAIYDIMLRSFQYQCYEWICQINQIPFEHYFYEHGSSYMQIRELKINSTFRDLSVFNWDKEVSTSSKEFCGRFTTLLLYYVVCNTHGIIEAIYEVLDIDAVSKRYKVYISLLEQWIIRVCSLILNLNRHTSDYYEELHEIYEFLILSGDYSNEVASMYLRVAQMDYKELESDEDEDDYINVESVVYNNLVKASYTVAANSIKVKHTPVYDPNFNIDDGRDRIQLVNGLGIAIMRRRMKRDKIPILYQLFIKANPKIYAEYGALPEYVLGAQVLSFLTFMTDNPIIKQYVNELLGYGAILGAGFNLLFFFYLFHY